jgi:hypothetical protein
MSKRFVITESEKNHIKNLYGIVTEQTENSCLKFDESSKTNVVDYDEIIAKYKTKLNTDDLNVVFSGINNDIQLFATKLISDGVETYTACEMGLIAIRPRFRDKNIIIINSMRHTIYFFDKELNDVTPYEDLQKKSPIPIITGREKQATSDEFKKFNLLNFEERRAYIAKYKNKKVSDVSDKEVFEFSGGASLNPGIYTTSNLSVPYTYLKTLDGKLLSQAIHKVLNDPERKDALIKAKDRTIFDLDDESINKSSNLSSGCINVPEWVINNPKYQELMKIPSYVFNLADIGSYYVQNGDFCSSKNQT